MYMRPEEREKRSTWPQERGKSARSLHKRVWGKDPKRDVLLTHTFVSGVEPTRGLQ